MKLLLASIAAVTVMASSPLTFADVPPERVDCPGKKVGDACTDRTTKKAGTCQADTCGSPTLDAGPTGYQCLTCSGPPPSHDGGCAIASKPTLKRVGPWLVAGMFSLLFFVGRRRRRSR